MKCKGAIFDMDGLLFDTERVYQETWNEIAEEKGIELGKSFLYDISGTNGSRMCNVIEKYYQAEDGTAIMEACMKRVGEKLSVQVPEKNGVRKILQSFKEKGVPLAVASSSNRQLIEANLAKTGIRPYFDVIVSGKDVAHGKPAPDIFLLAAEKLGCRPEECYVFEDSENGIKAGFAAGCKTVMIPDLIEPGSEIVPYCSMICKSLDQAEKALVSNLPFTGH